ncbi:hypothetical protein [Cytobacillus pseudoceanisediminis]|uniref:hypothetical protein n=1 Tax=Cytobacillus pseudoceanisediminis TaxID=3051614 RepID=UPI003C2B14A8
MKTRLLHVRANVKELSRALESGIKMCFRLFCWRLQALGNPNMYILSMREEKGFNNETLDLDGNDLGFVQDEVYKTSKEEEILGENSLKQ